jgi:hemerythrin superfamily protein
VSPSIAQQTDEQLGGPGSVLVRQRRDHERLDQLFTRFAAVARTDQPGVLREINQLVFSHAFAEEVVLWPAVRRSVPGGAALTARIEGEHQEINGLVAELERMSPDDPHWDARIERAFSVMRDDVRDEEDMVLPALQDVADVRQLQRLGTAWEIVRRTAPTRPHPAVARRPPDNAIRGVPLSAIDRVRDLLDGPQGRSALGGAALVAGHLRTSLSTATAKIRETAQSRG